MNGRVNQPGGMLAPYEEAFIRHCHELVGMAYERLGVEALLETEEPAITGHLVDKIKAMLDDPSVPRWAWHFGAADDEPKSVGGKTGKRRPRVDITLTRNVPRPSSTFFFEAKRLGQPNQLAGYLGEEGMLAMVSGHYGEHRISGMIGYVQNGTCGEWITKIQEAIQKNPKKYLAKIPVKFSRIDIPKLDIFRSEHLGQQSKMHTVTHTFLLFHEAAVDRST